MRNFYAGLAVITATVALWACDGGDDGGGNGGTAGTDSGLPDGGTDGATDGGGGGPASGDDGPATLSPKSCQADLALFSSTSSRPSNPPASHAGQIFGIRRVPTSDGDALALIDLVSEQVIITTGDSAPGFDADVKINVFESDISVPMGSKLERLEGEGIMALTADVQSPPLNLRRPTVFGYDGSALKRLLATGDTLPPVAGGSQDSVVSKIHSVRMSQDDIAVRVTLEGSDSNAIATVSDIDDGEFQWAVEDGELDDHPGYALSDVGEMMWFNASSALIATAAVSGPSTPAGGFAYLLVNAGTDPVCIASNALESCEHTVAQDKISADDVDANYFMSVAVSRDGTGPVMSLKFDNRKTELTAGDQFGDVTLRDFRFPQVCWKDSSVYFVGSIVDAEMRAGHELMRVSADGTVSRITRFLPLFHTPSLKGEVPDEIVDMGLGPECDAVMRVKGEPREGTNPYKGYWISYHDGDTMEITDETSGRDDNGNGDVRVTGDSITGIDNNAGWHDDLALGNGGQLDLILAEAPDKYTYARATKPKDRCRAPLVINSDGDAPDSAPGDGRCDTGSFIVADPECTLRAALEEANADPGIQTVTSDGPFTINVTEALPVITGALVLEGPLTINGAGLSGDAIGLEVDAEFVTLRDLTVTSFPSHGIHSTRPATFEDVDSTSNCGWGMSLDRGGSIAGSAGDPATIADNGTGTGCVAGGVRVNAYFSMTEGLDMPSPLTVSGVTSSSNNGPGILTAHSVELETVTLDSNVGEGLLVIAYDDGVQARLSGRVAVRDNRGNGIDVAADRTSISCQELVVSGNCGWGLEVLGNISLWGPMAGTTGLHVFDSNGKEPAGGGGGVFWDSDFGAPEPFTDVCGGGGLRLDADPEWSTSLAAGVRIDNNFGPGIEASGNANIVNAYISANAGAGVDAFNSLLVFDGGAISDNQGPGIFGQVSLESADIIVRGEVLIDRNVGAGVYTKRGDILLGDESIVTISNTIDDTCFLEVNGPLVTCPGGGTGVRTDDGDIDGDNTVIINNAGPGLSAADPNTMGLGIITLNGGRVCDNGAPDVAVTMNYTGLDVCM